MSVTMSRAVLPTSTRPLSSRVQRPRVAARGRFTIQANTIWQLAPEPKWAKSVKTKPSEIDLTGPIGTKSICTVGSAVDHSNDSDVAFECLGGGVHVNFESKGPSDSLDSPSALFFKDIDSSVDIKIDGRKVSKGDTVSLKAGSVLEFGDQSVYQVQRNVSAHA